MLSILDRVSDALIRRSARRATYGQLCRLSRRELDDIGISSASAAAMECAEMEVAAARAQRASRRGASLLRPAADGTMFRGDVIRTANGTPGI